MVVVVVGTSLSPRCGDGDKGEDDADSGGVFPSIKLSSGSDDGDEERGGKNDDDDDSAMARAQFIMVLEKRSGYYDYPEP